MSTVDKAFADNIALNNGYYNGDDEPSPDNPRTVLIIEYDNMFGGSGYGLVFEGRVNKYVPSEFVKNPRVYWEYKA